MIRRTARRTLRSIATGAFAVLGLIAGAQAAQPTENCRIAGLRQEVQCGAVTRPLDPAQPGGRSIVVRYVVVPALARNKLPDPLVLLAGGPGQSAIEVAGQVLPLLARLNNRRDIVFVDQRGTGRSAPLACADTRHLPLAEQSSLDGQLAQMRTCREQLQRLPHVQGADGLRFFTTTIAMQDLDAVRAAIGAERINLIGFSYGTRAGLEYLRQFPQRVRRSVLDGVAPPDMVLPASFSTDSQAAFDRVIAACERESACAKAYPTLRVDWQSLLAALPKPVSAVHPLTGQTERFTLTRQMLLSAVRGPMYQPFVASALPAAISAAAQGRLEPLLGVGGLLGSRRGPQLAMGMHFSVVCAEDVPRLAASTDSPGADFDREFAELYAKVCAEWPRGEVPAAFYTLPPATSPLLLLAGGADPATPPRHARRVAQALGSKAVMVEVAEAGHGVLGIGCARDLLFRFIDAPEDADALAIDAGCLKGVPRPGSYLPIELPIEGAR